MQRRGRREGRGYPPLAVRLRTHYVARTPPGWTTGGRGESGGFRRPGDGTAAPTRRDRTAAAGAPTQLRRGCTRRALGRVHRRGAHPDAGRARGGTDTPVHAAERPGRPYPDALFPPRGRVGPLRHAQPRGVYGGCVVAAGARWAAGPQAGGGSNKGPPPAVAAATWGGRRTRVASPPARRLGWANAKASRSQMHASSRDPQMSTEL